MLCIRVHISGVLLLSYLIANYLPLSLSRLPSSPYLQKVPQPRWPFQNLRYSTHATTIKYLRLQFYSSWRIALLPVGAISSVNSDWIGYASTYNLRFCHDLSGWTLNLTWFDTLLSEWRWNRLLISIWISQLTHGSVYLWSRPLKSLMTSNLYMAYIHDW